MFVVQLRVRKTFYAGVGMPYTWKTVRGFSYQSFDQAVKGAERMGVQQYLNSIARIKRV